MVLRRRFFRVVLQAGVLATGILGGFAPDRAVSSQEGMLPWSSFNIQSAGLGSSGPVTLGGTQNASGGLTSLTVKAFGREFVLSKAHLRDLQLKPAAIVNGLQLTYEHGYEEIGGRTLYVRVSNGFTSGEMASSLLTLKANGEISIQKVRSRP